MQRMLMTALLAAAAAACDGDSDLLYAKIDATQPDSPSFGKLASIFASAPINTSLEVRVDGGELRSATDLTVVDQLCLPIHCDKLLEAKIAVLPTADEAIVVAVLRERSTDPDAPCGGDPRTQILVPLQRAGGMGTDAGAKTP